MQDTQEYIDNLPTLKVADVAKLSNKEKLAIKHFKVSRGCGLCGCMVRTVSTAMKSIQCSNCCKQFKGLELPYSKAALSYQTQLLRGLNEVKLKPTTVGGVNADLTRQARNAAYRFRTNVLPLARCFGGMNTK
ncbi:hypothetical protein QGX12_gp133 [Pseudomonas phage Kremar]|uniref:Uncharacterized protein n=1 Tax=Pseudomonas phage Kremar TaxID=2928831 RepID=A0AAE9GS93_9CAUD|nr:hypothetical protein QGX12_gp133 [Pseudomonas phage Kremar]UOL48511.1 hypothetical protein [Pseudomonas phage Kremar]